MIAIVAQKNTETATLKVVSVKGGGERTSFSGKLNNKNTVISCCRA